ncbi:MAG: hypothetical protein QNJ70_13720 [Xenococcaceae cyanobacterium MO_207.B15]|nr:hypothetical protein [Xenococcaceae cyanobacterium MO_207.B15]
MGDIAFTIEKFVDLNKVVNLDIDKNVNVNVDNPDQLATAEADAEAFGPFALAEVDAYTYVNIEPDGETQTIFNSGQVQVEGGASVFAGTPPGDPLTIVFEDADDVNALGVLAPLDGNPAPPADTPLPQPTLTIDDLNLIDSGATPIPVTDGILYEYENPELFEIDFGMRWIDRNLNAIIDGGETGNLSLSVPEGDIWEVLFNTDTGAVEIDIAESNAIFLFTPDPMNPSDIPSNNDPFEVLAAFDLVADSLGDLGGYEFQALADFPYDTVTGGGDGEAFAYAESTAGLDLL